MHCKCNEHVLTYTDMQLYDKVLQLNRKRKLPADVDSTMLVTIDKVNMGTRTAQQKRTFRQGQGKGH